MMLLTRNRTSRPGRGPARAGAAAAASLLALSSCGTSDSPSAARSNTAAPTATPSADEPPETFYGAIKVTHDRQLTVRCAGSGSPTILLEAGGSGDMSDWSSSFVDTLAAETTTCLYSRAGAIGSTPVAGGPTRAQLVSDAYTMLGALRKDHAVHGPYVLVGWSFGGSVALSEALEHPETTAGMVILDTNFPSDFVPACIASGRTASVCQDEYDGDEEAKSIEKDIVAKVHPLPQIPIAVVSALLQPDCSEDPDAKEVTTDIAGTILSAPNCEALGVAIADKNRADWGRLGPQVTDTRLDADHDNLIEQAPDEIVALVLQMVRSARPA